MFRTVLVHVDHMRFPSDRVAAALGVARSFDGTLIGLAAGMPKLPYEIYSASIGSVGVGPEFTELDHDRLKAEFAKAKEAFAAATKGSGVEATWEELYVSPSVAIGSIATSADLVVLGSGDNSLLGHENMASPGEILLHTGRPVLLVPEGCREVKTGTVMVAWKEGPESQRALADALPFLKRAKSVTVVAVTEVVEGIETGASLARAGAFLVRHGIAASTKLLDREGAIHDQLTKVAASLGADMIVAGAYGHTRLREWIFGGVTREFLTRAPIPCLLSH